jgi:hypothetical protein
MVENIQIVEIILKSDIFRGEKGSTAPTDSRDVTERNTREALGSLTMEIERDPVLSTRYGRT